MQQTWNNQTTKKSHKKTLTEKSHTSLSSLPPFYFRLCVTQSFLNNQVWPKQNKGDH